jgi:hypothetical protein
MLRVVSNMYGTNKIATSPLRPFVIKHSMQLNRRRTPTCFTRKHITCVAVVNTIPHSVVVSTLACTAKACSYCFTYPLEAYKIYTQLGKQPKSLACLYQGFPIFFVMAISQSFVSYNIFFGMIETLKQWMPTHLTYFWASVVSCFLTSFIKVPLSFVSRNILFTKGVCGMSTVQHILSKMNDEVFRNSWLTTVLGDIPDSFVKFYVNDWMMNHMSYVNNFSRSCVTGFITSVVNMPLDYVLTQTLCNFKHFGHILSDNFLVKCMMGVQYRVLSCMVGNVVFFSMFNTLQSYYYIMVSS